MRLTITLLVIGFLVCCTQWAHAGAADRALAVLCPRGDIGAALIERESHRQLLHPALLVAVLAHESGCRSRARSGRGDWGAGQVRIGGSAARGATVAELLDPEVNVRLTAAHLARMITLCGGFGGLTVYSGQRRCRSSRYSRSVLQLFWRTFAEGIRARARS
jgi:hypothetical protein